MSTPITEAPRRTCRRCKKRSAIAHFERLPNGVRNVYCPACVSTACARLLERQRGRKSPAQAAAAKRSWMVAS